MTRVCQYFHELNLYKKSSSSAQTLLQERLSTRIYLHSLFAAFLAITIVSALVVRTVDRTEYSPSPKRFSQLIQKYADTLYCPCSTFGISYYTFVTVRAHFHQVCSSEFIEQKWIDLIFAEQNKTSFSSEDFRSTLSFFWQTIAGFCVASNRTWIDTVASFSASHFLSLAVIAEDLIRTQIQATLNNQIALSEALLASNLLGIRRATSGNQVVSALQTNFYLHYPPTDLNISRYPKMSPKMSTNCSCLNTEGCPYPATFNDSHGHLVKVPGMIADCLIVDGTLSSTLECYYDQTCFFLLHKSLSSTIKLLSNSVNRRFTINSTIQMLFDKMMLDEMTNEIDFVLYYSQCNPTYCSYSYAHRFDLLFIATTTIGIFSGLSSILKLLAPFIAKAILRWKNRHLETDNIVQVIHVPQNRRKLPNIVCH